ncbi:helix-turn-helix domain-containing protein [Amorphus sp. 3PC139-8]|uniref:helix-turn-helix domain-containing protein n=1 Tax=Amorphus sp. 3PC139-8 TaxID=2735676 RepID=UPI00345DB0F4
MSRDEYQTVREVADRLKVSEATVRHWIRAGDLRAIDIGKGWRIADRDLGAFLEGHATRPAGMTTAGGGEAERAGDAVAQETEERKI